MADSKKKRSRIILLVLTILTVLFIWGQSMLPTARSSNESKTVTEVIVKPVKEAITGNRTIKDNVVRKWAHAIEYAALGIELTLLIRGRQNLWLTLLRVFSYGTGIALLDETIQIFSGRGPKVQDVWIDALGVAIGMTVTTVVLVIIRVVKQHRSANHIRNER